MPLRAPSLRRRLAPAPGAISVPPPDPPSELHAAWQRLAGLEPWILRTQIELTSVAAPTHFEALRAEWMLRQFQKLGLNSELDPVGNVVAALGPAAAPAVLVTAHLDTAFPPGTTVEPQWREGRLWAPGIADNGSGLAALLALARVLAASPWPLRRRLLLAANVGEEGEGDLRGMRYLFETAPGAGAIAATVVIDGPGADQITCAALASHRLRVTLRAPGGHSWSDAGRASALHAAVRVAERILAQVAIEPGEQTCNLGWIQGGGAVTAIASEAAFKLDLRATRPERLEDLLRAVRRAVAAGVEAENRAALSGSVLAQVQTIGSRPGGALAPDAPLLRLVQGVDSALGIRSQMQCASTDANVPLALGLPAVRLGAGGSGGGVHTLQEWFDPAGRELALRRLLWVVYQLTATPDLPAPGLSE